VTDNRSLPDLGVIAKAQEAPVLDAVLLLADEVIE